MPLFTSKNKSGNRSVNFSMYDGIPSIRQGTAINVTLDDAANVLSVKERLGKKGPTTLRLSQICGIDILTEEEIVEQSKSVVGRAAVGGLLLGPLGALVGGMSGVGSKRKTESKSYVVINYHPSSAPNDTAVVSFEVVGASIGYRKFVNDIRALCHLDNASAESHTL